MKVTALEWEDESTGDTRIDAHGAVYPYEILVEPQTHSFDDEMIMRNEVSVAPEKDETLTTFKVKVQEKMAQVQERYEAKIASVSKEAESAKGAYMAEMKQTRAEEIEKIRAAHAAALESSSAAAAKDAAKHAEDFAMLKDTLTQAHNDQLQQAADEAATKIEDIRAYAEKCVNEAMKDSMALFGSLVHTNSNRHKAKAKPKTQSFDDDVITKAAGYNRLWHDRPRRTELLLEEQVVLNQLYPRHNKDTNCNSFCAKSFDRSLRVCQICNTGKMTPKDFMNHIQSSRHMKNTSTSVIICTPARPTKTRLQSVDGSLRVCQICNTGKMTPHDFMVHIQSSKHIQNTSTSITECVPARPIKTRPQSVDGSLRVCQICNTGKMTPKDFVFHIQGSKHIQNTSSVIICTPARPRTPHPQSVDGSLRVCQICNTGTMTPHDFMVHIQSSRHKYNTSTSTTSMISCTARPKTPHPQNLDACQICNTGLMTPKDFMNHIQSSRHKRNTSTSMISRMPARSKA